MAKGLEFGFFIIVSNMKRKKKQYLHFLPFYCSRHVRIVNQPHDADTKLKTSPEFKFD